VAFVAWSADDRRLVSASVGNPGQVRVWNADTGALLLTFATASPVNDLAALARMVTLSGDGRYLAASVTDEVSPTRVVNGSASPPLPPPGFTFQAVKVASAGGPVPQKMTPTPGGNRTLVWDLVAGKEVFRIANPSFALSLSADGKRLATLSPVQGGKVWDVPGNKEVCTLADQNVLRELASAIGLALSPDGRRLATYHSPQFGSLTVTLPDGRRLSSEPGLIELWDAATGARVATAKPIHAGPVSDVLWSPDGRRLLTSPRSAEGALTIWDAASGEAVATYRKETTEQSLAAARWSPDGRLIAAVTGVHAPRPRCGIQLWDVASGARLRASREGHAAFVYALRWSPDGKRLLSCSHDRTAKVWDVATGDLVRTLAGHAGDPPPGGNRIVFFFGGEYSFQNYRPGGGGYGDPTVQIAAMAWSRDGRRLATVSHFSLSGVGGFRSFSKVRVWDPATGEGVCVLGASAAPNGGGKAHAGTSDLLPPTWALAWSPDGGLLATLGNPSRGGTKPEVKVWQATTGTEVGSFFIDRDLPRTPVFGMPAGSVPMAFSPDGRRLAVETGSAVVLWDVTTRRVSRMLPAGTMGPLAWAPKGNRLVTLFSTARAASGTLGGKVPIGKRNAAPDETTVKLWDADTGTELLPLQRGEGVKALLWDADGKRLFVGARAGITVLDPETGTRFLTLGGEADQLFWGPGEKNLVSISAGGPKVWETGGYGAGR
jgi:WD40 repeat protein